MTSLDSLRTTLDDLTIDTAEGSPRQITPGASLEALPRYEYSALLTQSSIRLLQVHENDPNGVLQCTLKIVDLENDPSYHALSYTWGNPHANGVGFQDYFTQVGPQYTTDKLVPVLINGHLLRVQKNLHDALTQLPIAGPEVWIWIDAICIDQENMIERGDQVSIMDLIYQKAGLTIIWLGDEDEYTSTAVQTVKKLASVDRDAFLQSDILPYQQQDHTVYERVNVAFVSSDEWTALAALFLRQWFKRLWIVQETILSKRLVIHCGKYEVPWPDLIVVARTLVARYSVIGHPTCSRFIPPDGISIAIEYNVVKLDEWREDQAKSIENAINPSVLEKLLLDTVTFTSTDPRDKVYGTYGLLNFYQPGTRSKWTPDYNKSVAQCYSETVKAIIKDTNDLQIMSTLHDPTVQKLTGLPSWVPDLSLDYFNMMARSYHASGNSMMHIRDSSADWSRLRLNGAKLDTITQVGKDRPKELNSMMVLDAGWFELTLLVDTPYITGEPRSTVLWRTLIADLTASETPAPSSFAPLFRQLVCAMLCKRAIDEAQSAAAGNGGAPSLALAIQRVRNMWADEPLCSMSPADVYVSFNEPEHVMRAPHQQSLVHTLFKLHALSLTETQPGCCTPSLEELEEFWEHPTYAMWNTHGDLMIPPEPGFFHSFIRKYGRRKLFVTKRGYLGLGPASTREGDEVWLLPGAGGAFVFSEPDEEPMAGEADGTCRKVVGAAYVHGVMQGEAIERGEVVFEPLELV